MKWVLEPQGTCQSLARTICSCGRAPTGRSTRATNTARNGPCSSSSVMAARCPWSRWGPDVALAAVQRRDWHGWSRRVLATDDAPPGADALITARALASALRSTEADLVVAAVESTDGYTGTLPIMLAELIGCHQRDVRDLVRRGRRRRAASREADRHGHRGRGVAARPRATVTTGVAEPRYPSLKGDGREVQAGRPAIVADLGLGENDVRPAQRVVSVEAAPAKSGGRVIEAGPDTAAEIADLLTEARVIGRRASGSGLTSLPRGSPRRRRSCRRRPEPSARTSAPWRSGRGRPRRSRPSGTTAPPTCTRRTASASSSPPLAWPRTRWPPRRRALA